MGMALKGLGKKGKALWLEWSARSKKFVATDATPDRDADAVAYVRWVAAAAGRRAVSRKATERCSCSA
jgi:hypothetical protein